jgi:uncharacterized protein (TIGR02217 family)
MLQPILPSRWVITPADNVDDKDVFPFLAAQSFLIQKTPSWSTKTDISVSGVERRRALWSYPIWRFRIAHEYLRDTPDQLELQRLVTFFNSKFGSTVGFFYLDRFDNAASANQFGVGNGSTTTFQITRTTTIGGIKFSEPVRGFNGTPQIFINGVATSAFTMADLGQITFTTAPANGALLSWTGNFFFMCRFDRDELEGLGQIGSGIWQNGGLDFRSFKP